MTDSMVERVARAIKAYAANVDVRDASDSNPHGMAMPALGQFAGWIVLEADVSEAGD